MVGAGGEGDDLLEIWDELWCSLDELIISYVLGEKAEDAFVALFVR